ncbi:MAG TPA: hypothetical protein VMI92_02780 [Steroidobacteraceae bacterium]|nr:hypothetical protein [Steroidobacteraceae bacterium]
MHSPFRTLLLAGTLGALASSLAPQALANTAERTAAFAKLPDWSGVWKVEGQTDTFDPSGKAPPYNPEWAAAYAARRKTATSREDTMVRQCMAGVPRLMATPATFMVMVTPEETLLHFSRREIRHLWTDGRDHPPADELWPFTWADSIARWEGQVLVVDTISNKGDLWIDSTGAKLSDKAHITERISMPDKRHLRDELVIEDPVAFTSSWTVTRSYVRTSLKELPEQQCNPPQARQ